MNKDPAQLRAEACEYRAAAAAIKGSVMREAMEDIAAALEALADSLTPKCGSLS